MLEGEEENTLKGIRTNYGKGRANIEGERESCKGRGEVILEEERESWKRRGRASHIPSSAMMSGLPTVTVFFLGYVPR